MTDSPLCPRCGERDESVMHMLRDCRYVAELWQGRRLPQEFFTETITFIWVKTYSTSKHGAEFLSLIWHIWKARNTKVFGFKDLPGHVTTTQADAYLADTFHALQPDVLKRKPQHQRWVSWLPPEVNQFKLNTDGSVDSRGNAAAGGLVRDHLGQWIVGFSTNIGATHSFDAEMWGLLHGLRLCRTMGISNMIVELDSLTLVSIINEDFHPHGVLSTLLLQCIHLIHLVPNITVCHTLREGNRAADYLANLGHSIQPGITIYDSPPVGIATILLGDEMGIVFPRL